MENVNFCLCSIYKNEERNLSAFLENHKGLFQQWVMVDTGSRDRSNAIVRSFGIEPLFFQWVNDFSQARNFSLLHATADYYIIVLDIDEQILPADLERLRLLIGKTNRDVYSLVQINFTQNREDINWKSCLTLPPEFCSVSPGYIPSPLFRVFRADKGVRFSGRIHELAGPSVTRLQLTSAATDIPFYHYGWLEARSDEEKKRKQMNYRQLIQDEWEESQSPQAAFYYLKTLDDKNQKLRLAYKLIRQYPEVRQFWEIIAAVSADLGQWDRAISYCSKGLAHHPGDPALLSVQARSLNETACPAEALEIADELLKRDSGNPTYWYEKFRALIMLNRKDEARALAQHFPENFPSQLARELKNMAGV